jgi:hypothetical protein
VTTASWLLLAGCARRLPLELSLGTAVESAEGVAQGDDVETMLSSMLRGDPLARRPRLPEPRVGEDWEVPLQAFAAAVREVERGGASDPAASLRAVADAWPATAVVGLVWGADLQRAELALAHGDRRAVARAIGGLGPVSSGSATDPSRALHWAGEGSDAGEAALHLGGVRALTGWLAGPEVPVGPAAKALDGALYDRLAEEPIGRLVRARAAGRAGDPTAGLAELARATSLALERAAADRDREQAAWAERRDAERKELGLSGGDPVAARLDRAYEALVAIAGDDRAAGGALLALTARRWDAACGEARCRGLDRVAAMRLSEAWGADVAALARIWHVIAWAEALETLRASVGTVLFDTALIGMADAVLGTGGRLPVDLIEREAPEAPVWLALGRSVGEDGTLDADAALRALGRALANRADEAAAGALEDADRERLRRIALRAAP